MSTELFLSKLTTLNKNFINFVTEKLKEYPAADLAYMKHVASLDKMYASEEEVKSAPKFPERVIKKPLPPSAKLKTFGSAPVDVPKTTTNGSSSSSFLNTTSLTSKPVEVLKPSMETVSRSSEVTSTPSIAPFAFGINSSSISVEAPKKTDFFRTKPSETSSTSTQSMSTFPKFSSTINEAPKKSAESSIFSSTTSSNFTFGSFPSNNESKMTESTCPVFPTSGALFSLDKGSSLNSSVDVSKPNTEVAAFPSVSISNSPFIFGKLATSTPTSDAPKLSDLFGKNSNSSFSNTSGSVFSLGKLTSNTEKKEEIKNEEYQKEDEEKEEPPKVETVDQTEKDALYSVKCTMHVLKDTTWSKLGVGFANIKELGDKKQLLVRAATTLGTIWVNTVINNQIKAFKMNDKTIKFRCPEKVVNPTTKEESIKITMYLLKVGQPSDCDRLSDYLGAHPV